MKKTIYYFGLLLLFLAGASFLALKNPVQWAGAGMISSALAEDEEDEEDEKDEDEEDERDEEDEKDDSSSGSSSSKPKTVTTYTKLPDQIIKKLIETTIYDSDGDGIFDPDDSTPNLHNVFLVKDDNLNGVVDAYENRE